MKSASDKPVPTEPQTLRCEVCLTEIPASVATSAEGPDYVHHFCGIDCMDRWQKKSAQEQKTDKG